MLSYFLVRSKQKAKERKIQMFTFWAYANFFCGFALLFISGMLFATRKRNMLIPLSFFAGSCILFFFALVCAENAGIGTLREDKGVLLFGGDITGKSYSVITGKKLPSGKWVGIGVDEKTQKLTGLLLSGEPPEFFVVEDSPYHRYQPSPEVEAAHSFLAGER